MVYHFDAFEKFFELCSFPAIKYSYMKLNVSEPLYVELFHDTFPGNEVVPLRTILGSLEQVQVKNFDLFESEDSKILHCGRILHH